MLSSPPYSIISPVLKWTNCFVIGAAEPPARAGLSPARTPLMCGIQLDKGPGQPSEVTTGRAVGLGHLALFPGYTFSSTQRSPPDPLLALPSPLPSRLHSPLFYSSLIHIPPIFSHLFQLFQSLQDLNTFFSFTHQFFLSSSFSLSPFSLLFLSLFNTICLGKNTSAAK